jgi:predicted dehydrogenase
MTVRLGIIGSGFAASTIAAAAAVTDAVRVAGVYGGSRAASLAARSGAEHLDDLGALLAVVDAVAVAGPHETHAGYCRAAISAGRHVFCEKPFVTDPDDGARILDLAHERGVCLSVNHFQRYRIPNAAAGDFLAGGAAGDVLGGQCRLIEAPMDRPWQAAPVSVGFLLGYGVHAVDLLCQWFGRTVSSVRGRSLVDAAGVERSTSAVLTFGDLEMHLVTADSAPAGTHAGQVGRATFETLLVTERGLVSVDSYGEAVAISPAGRTLLGALPRWQAFDAPERLAAYSAALAQFVRACVGAEPPRITGEQALHAVRVCRAVAESAAHTGRQICL